METKKKTKIYVQMLGGFSITVGDEKLDLGSNSKANFLKLTEIVLLRGMGGVSKRDLGCREERLLTEKEGCMHPRTIRIMNIS